MHCPVPLPQSSALLPKHTLLPPIRSKFSRLFMFLLTWQYIIDIPYALPFLSYTFLPFSSIFILPHPFINEHDSSEQYSTLPFSKSLQAFSVKDFFLMPLSAFFIQISLYSPINPSSYIQVQCLFFNPFPRVMVAGHYFPGVTCHQLACLA